ncbi:Rhs element Vgr protein [Lysobacter sp. A03]|nr:Rhs element Vgr protein [Lysobacter sp. A03]
MTAGNDVNWLSQGETVVAVAGGISLYSHGTPAPDSKPQTSTGIALHAAQGDVSARAHQNVATAAAKTSVTLASTQADVEIASPSKHVLATAAGAYLKLEGGDIELGAPGTIEFKAARKEWTSPQAARTQVRLPSGELKLCEFKSRGADAAGDGLIPLQC